VHFYNVRLPSRARETENQQSKLSGDSNELLPDTRAPALTGGADPQLATMGCGYGTGEHRGAPGGAARADLSIGVHPKGEMGRAPVCSRESRVKAES
jgi:hypothetical protein